VRGSLDGLTSPHPLSEGLPAAYQIDENAFGREFVEAFDEVLAPILVVLDDLDAYFDPALTASDFLRWLATWVGVQLVETWPRRRQAAQVSEAISMHPMRGTVNGLRRNVALYAGVAEEFVQIIDSGNVAWSLSPDGPYPGQRKAAVSVRVRVQDAATVDQRRIESIVAAAKPAHVAHTVEVSTE
jgi:phage tail-like protein